MCQKSKQLAIEYYNRVSLIHGLSIKYCSRSSKVVKLSKKNPKMLSISKTDFLFFKQVFTDDS